MQNYRNYFMNSMFGAFKSPQTILQQMMNDKNISDNPVAQNAVELLQKGDSKGLEELAMNLCKEKGINPEDAIKQIKSQFRM